MMKKIVSAIMASLMTVIMGFSCIVASAEVSDVKIDCSGAKEAGNSNKSLSVSKDTFQLGRITEDTQILVTFDIIKGEETPKEAPVNLVIQSFTDADNTLADAKGAVWATVAPKSYDATSATFYYSDLVKGYTSKDFTKTEYLHVIATTNFSIKVNSMTITACNDKVPETTTAATTTVADEKTTEATTQATTTAAAVVSNADEKTSGSSTFLLIGGIAAGVILTVVIVFVIMNKKSSEAFDVSTGEFINKKNLFEPTDSENNSDTKKK